MAAKSKKRKASPDKKRALKTGLAKLKKAGILSPKFDVRNAKYTPANLRKLDEFRGVVKGNLRTIKLKKSALEIAKDDGKKVVRDRVIIENVPGSRVIRVPSDPYGYRIKFEENNDGITRIEYQGSGKMNLDRYAKQIAKEFAGKKNVLIGFTVDGHRSHRIFNTAEDAVADFKRYTGRHKITAFNLYVIQRGKSGKWRPKQKVRRKKYRPAPGRLGQ